MSTTVITRIPTEILGEILHLLCPGPVAIPSGNFDTLWAAAQVCSRWRRAALGLHRLWNDLTITFCGDTRSDRAMVYYTKQCLLRSQDAPLFLEITEVTPYAISGLSFLTPHSARIRRLYIKAQSKLSFMEFPNLESLYMRALPYHYTPMEQTPALAELRIDSELEHVVMKHISQGFWPSLRLVECNVSERLMNKFLDMLESRAGEETGGSVKRISDVVVRCHDFKVTDDQWGRVRALRERGIRIAVEEQFVDVDWFAGTPDSSEGTRHTHYDEDGYDSDKVPSLGI